MEQTFSPLTKSEINLIASVYKLLPDELPGFVGRHQQKDMIQFVARTFARESHSICEAPTGTGKSFGYQIPGIVLALSRNKRLIISTETANLQDQIAGRDLRVLTDILKRLGMEASSVVVKGRERYICPLRLTERAGQSSLLDDDTETVAYSGLTTAWAGTWDGLRDSLDFKVPQPIWLKVANNRHACGNDRCPEAKACPHMEMKAGIKNAKIIVTNHAYLLSTIAAQAGGTGKKHPIVDFENNYYVFDEAHHLHDRCIEAFASNASVEEDFLDDAVRVMQSMGMGRTHALLIRGEALKGIGIALRKGIATILGSTDRYRFERGSVPAALSDLVEEYAASLKQICELFGEAIEEANGGKKDGMRPSLLALVGHASAIQGQMEELYDALQDFTMQGDSPRARWLARTKETYVLHAAPFEAAALARQMLWKNMKGVTLASATIASFGEFGPAIASLGLPKETMTIKLSSPLDYSRARIVVPKYLVDANSPGHELMVASVVRSKMFSGEHSGGLAYFTSRRKMEAVYASLDEEKKKAVIVQGQMSPSAMITEHKRRIDAGLTSVLFGLDSISEGVDLPGKYCTFVMVDKLPFPSPDDPILASHAEYLEEKGLHPFPLLMLPKAALKFAQVLGRLIRTEQDWGEVWVLDQRLVGKTYGKQLVKSTPFGNPVRV